MFDGELKRAVVMRDRHDNRGRRDTWTVGFGAVCAHVHIVSTLRPVESTRAHVFKTNGVLLLLLFEFVYVVFCHRGDETFFVFDHRVILVNSCLSVYDG